MILVVGTQGCSRCEMAKRILNQKQIQFQYILFDNLSETEQNAYMEQAKNVGKQNFPLIIKDNEIIDVKDV